MLTRRQLFIPEETNVNGHLTSHTLQITLMVIHYLMWSHALCIQNNCPYLVSHQIFVFSYTSLLSFIDTRLIQSLLISLNSSLLYLIIYIFIWVTQKVLHLRYQDTSWLSFREKVAVFPRIVRNGLTGWIQCRDFRGRTWNWLDTVQRFSW